jgi:2-oxoisovalerate dehydrogenase E1 component
VLVLYEASYTGAIGAEIAARIAEACFGELDAPVLRCGSLDTPIPFAASLEQQYLAESRLDDTMAALLSY